jgi:small subunit ribosomal protein S20
MANHKSAEKAYRKSLKERARNSSFLSRVKTFVKKVESFISAGKVEDAKAAMRETESEIMKCVTRGVIKKNAASRKVSRITKKIKALEPAYK